MLAVSYDVVACVLAVSYDAVAADDPVSVVAAADPVACGSGGGANDACELEGGVPAVGATPVFEEGSIQLYGIAAA